MTIEQILSIVISILTGLITAIPLVIALVKYVQRAIKEKNWTNLLSLVARLIEAAEVNPDLTTGIARKAWVMAEVKAAAGTINYDIDLEAVSALIDNLCDLTKKVNTATLEVSHD